MRHVDKGRLGPPAVFEPGPAPMLQWIEIADLRIDDHYQRDLKSGNWATIKRIAAQFSWSRFSPVFVAPIEGGAYAIIDGQHRVHAALACGIERVPCQVVPMDRKEQAAAFAAVNGLVTRVTAFQVYRAALAAGDEWAVQAHKAAADAGCRLMDSNRSHWTKKPGEIFGVMTFRKLIQRFQPAGCITDALRILMSCDGWKDSADYWDNGLLIPVVAALCQRPRARANPAFAKAFEELDVETIAERIVSENRERIRKGLPYLGKKERLEAEILDWIDQRFPERIAVPKARA